MSAHRAILCMAFCVVVAGTGCQVHAADNKDALAGTETVRGRLVAKSGMALDVRAEDEQEVRRYLLGPPGAQMEPKAAAAFDKMAIIGSEVVLTWHSQGGYRIITKTEFVGAPGQSGLLAGTVTDVQLSGVIEIQDSEGKKQNYMPRWTATGFDKEMVEAVARRHAGDRVEIRFATDDHVRVCTLRVLELSPQTTTQPGFEGGTVAGKVSEKGKDFVVIKPDDGNQERYLPQRIVGEKDLLDKGVLKVMATVKAGDLVEAKWFRDGERRLYSLKLVTAAKPKATPTAP